MMNKRNGLQQKLVVTTIESLMPENHFLRKLDAVISFEFIYDMVAPLYGTTGRRSIDPVVIVKTMLLGYLYGIDSERRLEKEIEVNIAYRWFLGIDLEDKVPDHSTLSQLRRRKFKESTIFEELFDTIVRTCIEKGFIEGKILLTDSSHVRANVRNDISECITVEVTPSEYVKRINREAEQAGLCDTIKKIDQCELGTKEVRKSLVDPDAGFMKRVGKPLGFYYLTHQTCDAKHGLVTDVYVTAGNAHDATVHSGRICHQIDKFGLQTESVCADSGYDAGEIHFDMLSRGIQTYIPKRRIGVSNTELFKAEEFAYDEQNDVLICPNGCTLKFLTFQPKTGAKRYTASKKQCDSCPLRAQCIADTTAHRQVNRAYHRSAADIQHQRDGSTAYFDALRLRKVFCEGNFSHQKARHNLTRVNKIGLSNASMHCLLSACALNLRRMVKLSFG